MPLFTAPIPPTTAPAARRHQPKFRFVIQRKPRLQQCGAGETVTRLFLHLAQSNRLVVSGVAPLII